MTSAEDTLLSDLYQLTMLQGYYEHGFEDMAVFEFFVRKLPEARAFLIAAGLEQVLDFLQQLHFGSEEIQWLEQTGRFKQAVLKRLADFRFTGDVHAMPEGTVFFAGEPVLRVTAPLPEAQFIESRLINLLNFQTMIASKAVRSVLAAGNRLLVDFGMRRAHGAEAALMAAKACYLAGFSGSATVAAGKAFDMPLYGTMAHSFVQVHRCEKEAFINFAKANPEQVVLLIDTYNTEEAAQTIVELAPELAARGITIKGVRLDSGDLADHARKVRAILDQAGLQQITIFASGNLDEYAIETLLDQQAPIDGFGLGTRLDTSSDAPYLDCVYKLTEYAGIGRRKHSEGKVTWPGRKQVYRLYDANATMQSDTVTLDGTGHAGQPLLQHVMTGGRRIAKSPSLDSIRHHVREQLDRLPATLRTLHQAPGYPVEISEELRELALSVDRLISDRLCSRLSTDG